MGFKDDYDFDLLVNEAKDLVINELDKQLADEKFDKICKCQDCILDMATFSLNKLKPKYRSSFIGKIYAQELYEGDYLKDVTKTVSEAIKKISKNPAHDIES